MARNLPDMNCHIFEYIGSSEVSKNLLVDPPPTTPYWITFWFARSSADSMGFSRVSTVKNAARLAVYDAIMIMANKNHTLARILYFEKECCFQIYCLVCMNFS